MRILRLQKKTNLLFYLTNMVFTFSEIEVSTLAICQNYQIQGIETKICISFCNFKLYGDRNILTLLRCKVLFYVLTQENFSYTLPIWNKRT